MNAILFFLLVKGVENVHELYALPVKGLEISLLFFPCLRYQSQECKKQQQRV